MQTTLIAEVLNALCCLSAIMLFIAHNDQFHCCSADSKQMQGHLQTLKFLTSYDQEEPKLTLWDAWGLLLHQSVR